MSVNASLPLRCAAAAPSCHHAFIRTGRSFRTVAVCASHCGTASRACVLAMECVGVGVLHSWSARRADVPWRAVCARVSQAIALVYDATDRESFENIVSWTEQIEQVRGRSLLLLLLPRLSLPLLLSGRVFAQASRCTALTCVAATVLRRVDVLCVQHADAGVSKVLIGNKCDIVGKIQVSEAEGRALAEKYNIPFFLASAKNNINVTEVRAGVLRALGW